MKRRALSALCVAVVALGAAAPAAQGAFDDPLFIMRPKPPPPQPPPLPPLPPAPPTRGVLEGPCGIAVDGAGGVYISDYYNHAVDFFGGGLAPSYPYGYTSQITPVDILDGPCGLALDGAGHLYVNDFHRGVIRFTTAPFDTGTVIAGAPLDAARPTGVTADPGSDEVYVDERDRIAVFDSAGVEQGQIGAGNLQDGYGIARSGFSGTKGLLYVPDAATDTVKVYDPTPGGVSPVQVIDGSGTPAGHFTSLRNAAVAVDDQTGEVYVTDTLMPEFSELSETVVDVFSAGGAYEGRLKYSIENALPAGLAVDNSSAAGQGRVYVTTGNTEKAAVYVYPPGAATSAAVPLPGPASVASPAAPAPDGALGAAVAGAAIPAPTSSTSVAAGTSATAANRAQAHRHHHRHRRQGAKGGRRKR